MNATTATPATPVDQLPAPIDRARAAVGYDAALAELQELAQRSANITTITNKAGREECHARLMVLRNRRVEIDKAGKAARADANAYAAAVITVADELIAVISPEEERLAKLRAEYDEAEERRRREEAEKAQAELRRQRDNIAAITSLLGRLFGANVPALTAALAELDQVDLEDYDDVHRPLAEMALADARRAIEGAIAERRELDRKAAELVEQQRQADEEAARRRAQQESEDRERAERQRQEDEAREAERAERDRQEQAERQQRQAEEQRAREVQAEIDSLTRVGQEPAAGVDDLRARIDALVGLTLTAETFGNRLPTAEYARESSINTLRSRLQAAEIQAERDRQAEIERQAEQQRQEEARRAEAERQAQLERERAQERAQVEAAAIEAATLRTAAEEAFVLLQEVAPGHLTTRKLAAALEREMQA